MFYDGDRMLPTLLPAATLPRSSSRRSRWRCCRNPGVGIWRSIGWRRILRRRRQRDRRVSDHIFDQPGEGDHRVCATAAARSRKQCADGCDSAGWAGAGDDCSP
jgi:hypothetical protein